MPRKEQATDGTTFLTGGAGLPTGAIFMWPLATNPPGALLCRGGTFSSTQYPELAKVVGDTFGTHSGTTYYLPNFDGRSPIGVGQSGTGTGYAYSLGQKFGHELTQSHSHGVTDPGHTHYIGAWSTSVYAGGAASGAVAFGGPTTHFNYTAVVYNGTNISINGYGGGNSENVHPVLGIYFAIKI